MPFEYRKPKPQPSPETTLADKLGGFGHLQNAVGIARGEAPGQIHPELAGLPKERLAELDRFGQFGNVGQELGIIGLPSAALTALSNEYIAKNKYGGRILSKLTGDPQFEVDESTSKPSFGNVRAAMRGYLEGMRRR